MERREVPLDLFVLADLGLPSDHAALGRIRAVEPADFAAFMAGLSPTVSIAAGGGRFDLTVTEPRGFRPEPVAARLPEAAALLELRRKLAQQVITSRELEAILSGLPEASPLKRALRGVIAAESAPPSTPLPTAAPAAPRTATPAPTPAPASSEGDGIDALFAMVDTGTAPTAPGASPPVTPATRALDALVRELTGSVGVVRTATQRGLAAAVDLALANTLRPVLHDPAFVALEQTWSGLRFLLRRIDHRAGIKVHVLATTRDKLAGHVRELLPAFAADRRAEGRTVVAVVDFDLGSDPAALAPLAAAAASVHTPLVAGLDPALLGLESFGALDSLDEIAKRLEADDRAAWNALRADPNTRWLFLAANRFLLRLPYGKEHDAIKDFAFEENADGITFHAWGRAVWALAERIAASAARCGWGVDLTGQQEEVPIGDLPVRMVTLKTGEEVPVALEALVTERRSMELAQAGLVTLLCKRDGDQAFLAAAPSVHRAEVARTGSEARRDSLPFAMCVAQCSAVLAHLKANLGDDPTVLAPALERATAVREGALLEVHAAPDSLNVTPWRDPLRGLPGFLLPLFPAR